MIKFNLLLPKQVRRQVERRARREGKSSAALVREGIEMRLKVSEKVEAKT